MHAARLSPLTPHPYHSSFTLTHRYEYTQLASHPAVIVVPYTKSTMTFFELYRMGLPIFVPSLALLVRWELQRHVLSGVLPCLDPKTLDSLLQLPRLFVLRTQMSWG